MSGLRVAAPLWLSYLIHPLYLAALATLCLHPAMSTVVSQQADMASEPIISDFRQTMV